MTDIHKLPDTVFIAVLEAKRLPTKFDPEGTEPLPEAEVITSMKEALAASKTQWNRLIDNLTIEEALALREVKVSRSGVIKTSEHSGKAISVTISGRTVTEEYLQERTAPWLSLSYSGGKLKLDPNEQAGSIRRKAFAQYEVDNGRSQAAAATEGEFTLSSITAVTNAIKALSNKDEMIRLARLALRRNTQAEEAIKTHDTTAQFEAFMSKKRRQMNTVASMNRGKPTINSLTIPSRRTKASRTWGIEVESGGARYAHTPAGWSRKYDGSLRSAYNNFSGNVGEYFIEVEDCEFEHFDTASDEYTNPIECGSCGIQVRDSDDTQGDDCGEFVSPILRTFHSNGLKQLVKELKREPQNTTSGVHVHVGADGLTPRQLGGLVYAYQIIEPLIVDSYKREVREYCRERTVDQVIAVVKSAKRAKSTGISRNSGEPGLSHGDRYHSVNLQALNAHGTVEFRAMGPVYNYEHLIRWAYFCREMVNLAAANVPAKLWASVKSWEDVTALFAKYGKETPNFVIAEMEESLSRTEELELV